MSVRILCAGDVHLGRRPAGLPAGPETLACSPAGVWRALVDEAITRHVDAVALTGDIVDEANRFYEAFSVLHAGVEELLRAGVPVFAIGGNHDHDVLPRLAEQIAGFQFLGAGGRWQEKVLELDGRPVLRFQGWSFPRRHVTSSPWAGYVRANDDIPTVGLLHCDCGVAASSYGPVALADLKALGPQVWLLGHIHKPAVLSAEDPLILYPGSPQGLDSSERGAHGAWIITLRAGETPSLEMLPLAVLRWECVDVSVEGLAQEAVLQQRVVEAIRTTHEQIREQLGPARKVGCRLCLAGRTPLHRHVGAIGTLIQQDLSPTFDGVDYFIESFEDLTRPDVSLEDLARSNDPAGLLAQRLVLLESRQPIDDYRAIIADARDAIEAQSSAPTFASLPDVAGPMSEEQVRSVLLKAGLAALDQMLAQKETQA